MVSGKRVVIVTGAGAGLGRAYALELAARGYCVLVNNRRRDLDASGRSSAEQVTEEIARAGGEAAANDADATDPGSGVAMVEQALSTWGRLDALIANAGVDQHQPFHKISVEQFRGIFDINFFGTLYAVHACYAHMRARGHGRMVVSTSSAGLHGLHGLSSYAASKAALLGLMRTVAAEGQSRDVLCNAIAPYAATRMTEKNGANDVLKDLPPQQVATLVAQLVSADSRVNAQTIVAGGGGFRLAGTVEETTLHAWDALRMSSEQLQAALNKTLAPEHSQSFPDALTAFSDFLRQLRELPR